MFKSRKFLTKAIFNSWIAEILRDFTDDWHKITGHSFRSAIPTALSTHPNEYSTAIIREGGGFHLVPTVILRMREISVRVYLK